jgi:hypothetical protein
MDETWHRTRGGIPKHVREHRSPTWMLELIVKKQKKEVT